MGGDGRRAPGGLLGAGGEERSRSPFPRAGRRMVAAALRRPARLKSMRQRGGLVIAFRVRGAWRQPGRRSAERLHRQRRRGGLRRRGAVPFSPSFPSLPPFLPSARSLVALRPDSCSGDGTSSRVLPEVPQLRGVEAQLVAAARLQPAGDGSAAGRGGPLPSLGGARSGSARRGPSRGFSGCLFAPLRRGKARSGSGGLRSLGGRGAAERRWC